MAILVEEVSSNLETNSLQRWVWCRLYSDCAVKGNHQSYTRHEQNKIKDGNLPIVSISHESVLHCVW